MSQRCVVVTGAGVGDFLPIVFSVFAGSVLKDFEHLRNGGKRKQRPAELICIVLSAGFHVAPQEIGPTGPDGPTAWIVRVHVSINVARIVLGIALLGAARPVATTPTAIGPNGAGAGESERIGGVNEAGLDSVPHAAVIARPSWFRKFIGSFVGVKAGSSTALKA
jgi:hypothetical protein